MKLLYTLLLTLTCVTASTAQLENPWVLGAGWSGFDDDGKRFEEVLHVRKNWVTMWLPNSFSIEKQMNSMFSIELAENANSYDIGDLRDGQPQTSTYAFMAVDVLGKYHVNSAYKKFMWFDPFVAAGTGLTLRRSDLGGTLNIGFGATFWVTEKIGLSAQSLAKFGLGTSGYLQHSGTVKIKIADKKIERPTGLAN